MYKCWPAIVKRSCHNNARNGSSLRIHRSTQSPSTCDGPSTSFMPNFKKAETVCNKFATKVDELTERVYAFEEQRTQYYLKKKNAIHNHMLFFKKLLDNGDRCLIPIGSSVNGLFSESSDIDMILMPYSDEKKCHEFSKKFQASQTFRHKYMSAVVSTLKRNKIVRGINVIENARVPIIKLDLSDGMKGDIQFNNPFNVFPNLYIKQCTEYDHRVATLIGWLKGSLTRAGLKNQNNFSSYHTTFLVLHFLNNRNCDLHIMPDFNSVDIRIPRTWKKAAHILASEESLVDNDSCTSKMSAGELIVYLADYYSQIKLSDVSLCLNGDVSSRSPDEPFRFINPYLHVDECICNAPSAPHVLAQHFSSVLQLAGEGMLRSV